MTTNRNLVATTIVLLALTACGSPEPESVQEPASQVTVTSTVTATASGDVAAPLPAVCFDAIIEGGELLRMQHDLAKLLGDHLERDIELIPDIFSGDNAALKAYTVSYEEVLGEIEALTVRQETNTYVDKSEACLTEKN